MKKIKLISFYLFLVVQLCHSNELPGNRSYTGSPLNITAVTGSSAKGNTVAGGNGQGAAANQLSHPTDIFIDATGNIYVADQFNDRIQKWAPGAVNGITVAGGNGRGSSLNQLSGPKGIFIDATGNIYIADQNIHRIQKWAPGAAAGVTVAGGNNRGSGANQFNMPSNVFVDAAGNIFVSDQGNNRIQKWAPNAVEGVTVAGGYGYGSAANELADPSGIFVDKAGNIFVADQSNNRIQKWAPGASTGITLAGGSGPGTANYQFIAPSGVFIDATGDLYVADQFNNRIQKFAPGSTVGVPVIGDNGAGSAPNQLNSPTSVYVDAGAHVYVADAQNNRIQLFIVPPVAGSPINGITVAGGNGAGSAANQFQNSIDVFVDPAGNIFVADNNNHRIQKWAPGASEGVTVAGGNGEGGAANQSIGTSSVFLDATGNIYVADEGNSRIQKWAPGASEGVTVAGGHGRGSEANQFNGANSVFVDAAGNIFVADQSNNRIQKWGPGASEGNTVAGGHGQGQGPNQLSFPISVFVDAAGNIFVSDQANSRIQKWAPGALAGITVAGGNGSGGAADQFEQPHDVFVDASGNIFVADGVNRRVQKWAPGATEGITVAGGHDYGSAANQLAWPWGIFVDAKGDLYVADMSNNRIQKFSLSSGLTYKYYEGIWNALPDFDAISLAKTGSSANIDASVRTPGRNDNYAFLWNGQINIPNPGTYTFETISDDGSNFYFNTPYSNAAIPTVANDGIHWAKPATATLNIPAAGAYPITLTYFEKDGGEDIQLFWTGPGIPRQRIPDEAFSSNTTDNISPGTPSNLHVVSKGGNYINLDWDAATDNVRVVAYDVFVDGVKKYTTTETEITAIDLTSALSYSFTITAKDFAGNSSFFSNAATASTTNLITGLTYKYYEGSWNAVPDFSTLVPVKIGNSPNVDIDVRTPGKDDNFAFLWQGFINITTPGNYIFETVSDDGSKLYFNGQFNSSSKLTVNNEGLHAPSSVTGTVYIAAPGSYPISISFFEKDGGEKMQVYWTGPNFPRQPIPDNAFVKAGPPITQGGLVYQYYEGYWNLLPDFKTLTAVKTGSSANVDLGVRTAGRNDNFALLWEGYIDIPTPGNYTFETRSDDGSKLYFNSHYDFSTIATINNDGSHALLSASGTVTVPKAGRYPIAISYFENGGEEQMELYWTGPGMDKQLIPGSAFTQTPPPPPQHGLRYKYYEGSWSSLPDFTSIEPVSIGFSDNVDIGVRPPARNDNFAFVWEGYLNIPTAGVYTFSTVSDDGSKFYFNTLYDVLALETIDNDGLHSPRFGYGTINIPAPGSYPVTISFFENAGGERMDLYWSGPGIPSQQIPNSAFFQALPPNNVSAKIAAASHLEKSADSPGNESAAISRIYPNPFNETINVDFYNTSAANDIEIGIYDMKGSLVYTYQAGKTSKGHHSVRVNLNGKKLSGGIYMAALKINGMQSKMVKLIKTK